MQEQSSDSAVASVDGNSAVSPTHRDLHGSPSPPRGGFTNYCHVRVVPAGSIGDGDLGLAVRLIPGESFLLEATSGEVPITWTFSDASVASVAATSENRIARVRGMDTGLCFILSCDANSEQVGRLYVRVD